MISSGRQQAAAQDHNVTLDACTSSHCELVQLLHPGSSATARHFHQMSSIHPSHSPDSRLNTNGSIAGMSRGPQHPAPCAQKHTSRNHLIQLCLGEESNCDNSWKLPMPSQDMLCAWAAMDVDDDTADIEWVTAGKRMQNFKRADTAKRLCVRG